MSPREHRRRPVALLITNIVTPYRLPVLRCLARQEEFDLHVCYLARTEGIRRWRIETSGLDFSHTFLPGFHFFIPGLDWNPHLNIGLLWLFVRLRPGVVICTGWDSLSYFFAVAYAKLWRAKLVLWSGTSGHRRLSHRTWVKKLKAWFIRQFDSYLAYGSRAADYLVEHGAPRGKIAVGFNTVDVNYFLKESERCRQGTMVESLRQQYPGKVILFVGRFLDYKRLDLLLEALSRMKEPDWTCLLIGWGPEEPQLRERCKALHLDGKVHFLDYLPPEELVRYYVLARVMVLPSQWEPWGLVVNEAMACGTPVVVSSGCGCVDDLVEEGRTGFSYRWDDTERLAELLDQLVRDDARCKAIGQGGREKVTAFTPERYARNLMHAMLELADSSGSSRSIGKRFN